MKKRYLAGSLILVFAFSFYLFHLFYEEAKREAIANTQKVQLVYARQAARSIEEIFESFKYKLTFYAGLDDVVYMSDMGRKYLTLMFHANKDILMNITRLDEFNRIVYAYPEEKEAIRQEIASNSNLLKALRQKKIVASDVLRTVNGYEAVALYVPIAKGDSYRGALAVAIDFKILAKLYLEEIKIGDTGYAWMISRDGIELYCPVPGHTGRSIFETCQDFPSILKMVEEMVKGNEGYYVYEFNQVREDYIEVGKKHAAYAPVTLPENHWSIAVATTEKEILTSITGFRNRLMVVIAFLLFVGVVVSYYINRAWFIVKEAKERERAEQAIRESEAKLSGIIEFLPDATFVVDIKGRVIAWNRAIEEMTGVSKKDMIGKGDRIMTSPFYGETRKHLLDLLDGEDKETEARYHNLQRKGNIIQAEAFAPALYNGRGAYIFAAAAPLFDQNGNRIGAVESIRDITSQKLAEQEKKNLEERLQRIEKMEAIGNLAAGIAHNLNNVLGVISGYAELMLYDMKEETPLRSHALKIRTGVDKAVGIVEDLLALSRRGMAGLQTINLNRIIEAFKRSSDFEKLKSEFPSIQISFDLEPEPLKISGSALHIGKALFNLVNFSCMSIVGKGVVNIKTRNIYLDKPVLGYDETPEGDYVMLSISDNGTGISEEDIKRIFEPFYTDKIMGKKGTGLGLAMVWGIVKDHNGYINVVSEPGKGSVFTIYFPVIRESTSRMEPTESIEGYMGKGEKILVVDDMKDQRELAAALLKKLNYQVHTVSSGEEACEYLKTDSADLVALDMIMDSGMDGLDTYRRILEINPKQKVIIVSGFSESDRIIEAQKLGVSQYIKKPYMLEKLGFAVRSELDRRDH